MNLTLGKILRHAEITRQKIYDDSSIADECINDLFFMKSYIDRLQNILHRANNIYTECSSKIINCDKSKDNKLELAPGITIKDSDIVRVKNISEVKNTKLYFVENINQFSIRINNIVFRGNIGNIVDDRIKTKACSFQELCKNNDCAFYHDPIKTGKFEIQNFSNENFIYNKNIVTRRNSNMLQIGSRDSLINDSKKIKAEYFDKHNSIVMHFLLTHLAAQRALSKKQHLE